MARDYLTIKGMWLINRNLTDLYIEAVKSTANMCVYSQG